jgi:hypothetical protein
VTLRLFSFVGAPFFAAVIDLGNSFGDAPEAIPTHIFPNLFHLELGGPDVVIGGLALARIVPEPSPLAFALVGALVAIGRSISRSTSRRAIGGGPRSHSDARGPLSNRS